VDERLQRAAEAVRSCGADWGAFTNFDSVVYLANHIAPIEAGQSPFAGGPTAAFVNCDGVCGLVAPNVEAAAAAGSWADTKIIYEAFGFERPIDLVASYAAAVERLTSRLGIAGVFAVEAESFTSELAEALKPKRVVPVREALKRVRATKTDEEKQLLRRSARAAAVGQETFYRAARPGRSELDVFAEIRAAIENFAGERTPITGDFLSGKVRTAASAGWPIGRRLEPGDPLMSDLAPRVGGYWGDSCSSSVLGEPSAGYLKLFKAAEDALRHALDIIRPGLIAADLDAEVRGVVAKAGFAYPHHTGHSIGASVHEWPRITPYEKARLESGMFVMIEPGAYDPSAGGVRLEWMIEIIPGGCRPAAPFEFRTNIFDLGANATPSGRGV